MVNARAVGFLCNDPLLLPNMFQALERWLSPVETVDGLGSAAITQDGVLISRIPKSPTQRNQIQDAVEKFKARNGLLHYRMQADLRPFRENQLGALGPYRAGGFAGIVVGGPQDPDKANASREALTHGLPEYLLRARESLAEGEAFFLKTLSILYAKGLLTPTAIWVKESLAEIRQLMESADSDSPRCVLLGNQQQTLIVSRQMPAAVFLTQGPPRGIVLAGGLNKALKVPKDLPLGLKIQSSVEDSAFWVDRDFRFVKG